MPEHASILWEALLLVYLQRRPTIWPLGKKPKCRKIEVTRFVLEHYLVWHFNGIICIIYLAANPLFWRYSWILSSSSTGNWAILFYTKEPQEFYRTEIRKLPRNTFTRSTQLQADKVKRNKHSRIYILKNSPNATTSSPFGCTLNHCSPWPWPYPKCLAGVGWWVFTCRVAASSISTRRQASVSTMRASTRNGVRSSLSTYRVSTAPDWLRWIPSKHCRVFFRVVGYVLKHHKTVEKVTVSLEYKGLVAKRKDTRKKLQVTTTWSISSSPCEWVTGLFN